MTITADGQRELQILLEQEIAAATALLDILTKEHAAVADRNAAELERILADKQSCIDNLETLTARRNSALTNAGYSTVQSAMEFFKAGAGGSLRLTSLWQQLRDVVTQCHRQNQGNGRLVALQRRKTELALNVLRGQGPGNESYGPDGATVSGPASRSLTSV